MLTALVSTCSCSSGCFGICGLAWDRVPTDPSDSQAVNTVLLINWGLPICNFSGSSMTASPSRPFRPKFAEHPRLRSKRAHTQAMVVGQLKKSQQSRATAFGSHQITVLCGPAEFSGSAHSCVVGFQADKLKDAALCALHALPAICALGQQAQEYTCRLKRKLLCLRKHFGLLLQLI